MKKSVIFLLVIFWCLLLNAKEDWNYKNYFKADSAIIYSWDTGSQTWILSSRQINFYRINGWLDSTIVRSIQTGQNLSKSELIYDETGLVTNQTFYGWNGSWIPSERDLITYDSGNNYSQILIQYFSGNTWVNKRLQKYTKYDLTGNLTEFEMYEWENENWVFHLYDDWYYDNSGKLIKRLAVYKDNSPYYQILYKYNEAGLRTDMYAQFASGNIWNNTWLQTFQYNDCGNQISQIQYYGSGADWVPSSKTVLFNSFDFLSYPGKKVPVCHNGNTIYVAREAVNAHLAHGDCLGECTSEKKTGNRKIDEFEDHNKKPFTIYPNPARDKFNVKFENDDPNESKKVELTDFYGKLLKTFNVKGNGDLTIYRNSLPKGTYYVRVAGKLTYCEMVIFD